MNLFQPLSWVGRHAHLGLQFLSRFVCAWQKISDSGKKPFAKKSLPLLIQSVEVFCLSCLEIVLQVLWNLALKSLLSYFVLILETETMQVIRESDIRATSIQVLFSAVYHLKSVVSPYAYDLLKLSLKALKKGSEKVLKLSYHSLTLIYCS